MEGPRLLHRPGEGRHGLARDFPDPPLPDRVLLYRSKGKGRPRAMASVTTAWLSTLARAGLDGRYTFHDTRDSFCSYLAARGATATDIQKLAGHASITTTMRYTKAADQRLRDAVALLEPAQKSHTELPHEEEDDTAEAS